MVRYTRWPGWALGCFSLLAVAALPGAAWGSSSLPDREQTPAASPAPAAPGAKPDVAAVFSQPGDDPPRPFVPLDASTVDDRQRTEALRLYAAARALEDRGSYNDAVTLLQQAQKLDPESVAILRRLSRIYIGALGRLDQAVELGKKVLAVEPGDTDTLARLVEFYGKKNDQASAEALQSLLKEVLANPKLDAHAPGRLVALNELGKLYSVRIKNQIENAAKAFAEVMAGLDDKAANKLSPLDLARILGNDPAAAYLNFGMVFLAAKKDDLAVRAFERGLVYDEENPQIPLLLAETLLKQNKGQQALALVERYIKRQPQALEAYELMAKVLTALKREDEITPRLEEAARRDSKNVPLQYVLADRYRETGQVDKADALYKSLLTSQPTPQTYRALAASLLKRKKAADLLKVVCEAMSRPNGLEAISGQLQAAASDDAMAEQMLDAGIEQLKAKPPTLPNTAFFVLSFIANPDRGADKTGRLERLIKLQRLLLEQNPNPKVYLEIADTLRNLDKNAEAAATIAQMMEKYPTEKSGGTSASMAELHRRAGKLDAALASARQAAQLDPNDVEVQLMLADLLGDTGKIDEALEIFRKAIKHEPDNARYRFLLGGMLAKFGRNEDAIKVFQEAAQAVRQQRTRSSSSPAPTCRSSTSTRAITPRERPSSRSSSSGLPTTPDVNNDLGYLYAEQGKNLEKAESMIRKAVQEEPDKAGLPR